MALNFLSYTRLLRVCVCVCVCVRARARDHPHEYRRTEWVTGLAGHSLLQRETVNELLFDFLRDVGEIFKAAHVSTSHVDASDDL